MASWCFIPESFPAIFLLPVLEASPLRWPGCDTKPRSVNHSLVPYEIKSSSPVAVGIPQPSTISDDVQHENPMVGGVQAGIELETLTWQVGKRMTYECL